LKVAEHTYEANFNRVTVTLSTWYPFSFR